MSVRFDISQSSRQCPKNCADSSQKESKVSSREHVEGNDVEDESMSVEEEGSSNSDEDASSDSDEEEDEKIGICDDVGAYSQDPRSLFERLVWNESDVRFFNETNREVLFIIADEEFTLKRTTKASAGTSSNDDDDVGGSSLFGLIPIRACASRSTTVTQTALRTRCMPLAPQSSSSQHFQDERLTYVTALTKDNDGEENPWTRVHYENRVINSKRTKSLKFFNKHLRVTAYRITHQIAFPAKKELKRLSSGRERKRIGLSKQESMKRLKNSPEHT
eukprot:CAMPEP_0197435136 /NCGR_PEP_ID=MMETSP1175-20131217/2765_1 /TAXON_ID=1003142 /ORGANISM="Triceratium dubium, Strain CCMP147" /LENGTH=275 /DNA_ID=CAMNT_0042964085 /DNA_START=106 /DNA_END=933 /DNA_ORIENTATION=-